MTRNRLLAGIVAGLTLLSACSQAAPPATQPVASVPASAGQSAPDAGVGAGDIIDRLSAAQAGVKTYAVDMSMDTAMMGNQAKISMTGKVDQTDPAKVKMDLSTDFAGMKMKLRQLGDEMYLQLDAAGDTWMQVPADQRSQYDTTTGSTDLSAKLREVKDSVKQVEKVGEESVDGTPTTHYRIDIDGSALSKLTGSDGEIDADAFTYDVWVDAADLVRKVSMNLEAEIDGKSMPFKIDGTMSHYNEPVTIEAPPKDKIVEMPG